MTTAIAGIDVGKYTSSICILDPTTGHGQSVDVDTDPAVFADVLRESGHTFESVAFEAGHATHRLAMALASAGFPAVVIDARSAAPYLRMIRAMKTDKNDAYAIAELVRRNAHKAVWVKSQEAAQFMTVLTLRDNVIRTERVLRAGIAGHMASRGEKIRQIGRRTYHRRIHDFIAANEDFQFARPILWSLVRLDSTIRKLDKEIEDLVGQSEVCQLLMTVPGVGPKTAAWYRAVIDHPGRFRNSRDVGAYLGLIPRVRQSGLRSSVGRITKTGSKPLRGSLHMAATTLLFSVRKEYRLRSWGLSIAERCGKPKATVAVARKLSIILHRIWASGEPFQDR